MIDVVQLVKANLIERGDIVRRVWSAGREERGEVKSVFTEQPSGRNMAMVDFGHGQPQKMQIADLVKIADGGASTQKDR